MAATVRLRRLPFPHPRCTRTRSPKEGPGLDPKGYDLVCRMPGCCYREGVGSGCQPAMAHGLIPLGGVHPLQSRSVCLLAFFLFPFSPAYPCTLLQPLGSNCDDSRRSASPGCPGRRASDTATVQSGSALQSGSEHEFAYILRSTTDCYEYS